MLKSFILCILCVFAVFGLFCMSVLYMTKSAQKVPIIICTYNDEDEIEAKLRLEMVKNPGSDIIVVDLGSQDETEKIVRTLCLKYGYIRFIQRDLAYGTKMAKV